MATRRGGGVARSVGRGIFVWLMVVLIGVGVALGVQESIDAANDEPVVWGTFRETECIWRGRGGCRSYGTWVSDNGDVVRDYVQLSGVPGPDRTVRAGFRPHGLRNSEDSGLVYTEPWVRAGPWAAGGFVAFLVVVLAVFLRSGRRRTL